MKLSGEVIGLRTEGLADEYVTVTIQLRVFVRGTIDMRLKPHQARGYKLGRMVEVSIDLTGRYLWPPSKE